MKVREREGKGEKLTKNGGGAAEDGAASDARPERENREERERGRLGERERREERISGGQQRRRGG